MTPLSTEVVSYRYEYQYWFLLDFNGSGIHKTLVTTSGKETRKKTHDGYRYDRYTLWTASLRPWWWIVVCACVNRTPVFLWIFYYCCSIYCG